ncbi:HMG-CoA reductase [Histoplasma capsulatum H143]|uniref:HMG-CoA reductase n=1 Tax=Ajellomyces capsulatus (strain H143) TaxID=544712 RepID=C6H9K9_AJECH|nr:HMG-CoA reductase [Histoplasma capsulatum H143]
MRGSWLIPKRFRNVNAADSAEAGWLNRRLTTALQKAASRACLHPIHTIVVIALLASTTYVGLLEGSLFDAARDVGAGPGQLDVESLLNGARTLRLGETTGWRWQVGNDAQVEDTKVFTCPLPHPISSLTK